MTTTEIEISVVLPEIPTPEDSCTARLAALAESRAGIERAHVIVDEGRAARLCVHYDPALISLERLRQLVRARGAELSTRYLHLDFNIATARPQHRRQLEEAVRRVVGVLEAEASETGSLRVEFDSEVGDVEVLRRAVAKLDGDRGVHEHAEGESDGGHYHEHGALGTKLEIGASAIGAVAWVVALILGLFDVGTSAQLPLYIGVYATTGVFVARDALGSWLSRRVEIDSLMIAAAGGAAVLGAWSEGALLLVLFAIGHALERFAMQRARRAIEALGDLAPETALVISNDGEETVAVAELAIGDRVRVRAHERIPADGIVVSGVGAVNEAPITGESVPVDKEPALDPSAALESWETAARQHRVFAGSINDAASLDILVARPAGASTLARLVKMVSEAETLKSPTQRLTDRFERIFVPTVLLGAGLLFFAWVVVDETFAASAYRALAVLVAASPCALAIATPSAVLSGVARAGQRGVLIKGGGPLEELGRVRAVALDKTGTLTKGEPRVTDIVPTAAASEDELAAVARALEATSEHPLARAITRDLDGKGVALEVAGARAIVGRGLTGIIDGETAWVGSRRLFAEEGAPGLSPATLATVSGLEEIGRTTAIVALGSRILGVLGIMDEPRPDAARAISALRNSGVETIVMLSGDNLNAAKAIGDAIGVDDARGGLMPEDKVAAIKEIRDAEGGVAMVGDGVNDAPALATASVGIAMGAAGSDVALETADIALMSDDLSQLSFAISLSRKSAKIIRQNLRLSLGVVALLIPATILGLGIGPAVVAHEGSTLVVVGNALRLLRHR